MYAILERLEKIEKLVQQRNTMSYRGRTYKENQNSKSTLFTPGEHIYGTKENILHI